MYMPWMSERSCDPRFSNGNIEINDRKDVCRLSFFLLDRVNQKKIGQWRKTLIYVYIYKDCTIICKDHFTLIFYKLTTGMIGALCARQIYCRCNGGKEDHHFSFSA